MLNTILGLILPIRLGVIFGMVRDLLGVLDSIKSQNFFKYFKSRSAAGGASPPARTPSDPLDPQPPHT